LDRKGLEQRSGKDSGDQNGVLVKIWKIFHYFVLRFALVCCCLPSISVSTYNATHIGLRVFVESVDLTTFTARRYAKAQSCCRPVSVCHVRIIVSRRLKKIIFKLPSLSGRAPTSNCKGTPSAGALNTLGWENFAIFDTNRRLSRKRYEIGHDCYGMLIGSHRSIRVVPVTE